MFLDILVAIDGSASSWEALNHGIELARAGNAKLTLITVAPTVSGYVTLVGVSNEKTRAELDRWAGELLVEASAQVPEDVIAHTVQKTGEAGPEIVKELDRGAYDLVCSVLEAADAHRRACSEVSRPMFITTRACRCFRSQAAGRQARPNRVWPAWVVSRDQGQ